MRNLGSRQVWGLTVLFRKQFNEVEDACALAQAIVDTVREPLIVLDKDLRVVAASRLEEYDVEHEFSRIGRRVMLLNARIVRYEKAHTSRKITCCDRKKCCFTKSSTVLRTVFRLLPVSS